MQAWKWETTLGELDIGASEDLLSFKATYLIKFSC